MRIHSDFPPNIRTISLILSFYAIRPFLLLSLSPHTLPSGPDWVRLSLMNIYFFALSPSSSLFPPLEKSFHKRPVGRRRRSWELVLREAESAAGTAEPQPPVSYEGKGLVMESRPDRLVQDDNPLSQDSFSLPHHRQEKPPAAAGSENAVTTSRVVTITRSGRVRERPQVIAS